MILTYTPAGGGSPEVHQLSIGKIRRSLGAEAERIYGSSLERCWLDALELGTMMSTAVLLYLCRKQGNPKYKWSDLPDFELDEVDIQREADDIRRMIGKAERVTGVDPERKEEGLAELREALSRLELEESAEGKDPAISTSSSENTGSTSASTATSDPES